MARAGRRIGSACGVEEAWHSWRLVQVILERGEFFLERSERFFFELWFFSSEDGGESAALGTREFDRVHFVFFEGFVGEWRDGFSAFGECLRVNADFVLCMRVGAEVNEVEQVVEVNLPVPLGVEGKWQIDSRKFACEAGSKHLFVVFISIRVRLFEFLDKFQRVFERDGFVAAALFVDLGLKANLFGFWEIEFIFHDTVSAADFV